MRNFSPNEILKFLKGILIGFSDLESFRKTWLLGLYDLKEAPISLLFCTVRLSRENPEIKRLKDEIILRLAGFPDRVAELLCQFIAICEEHIDHPEAYEKVKETTLVKELLPLLIRIKKTHSWPITSAEDNEKKCYDYPVFIVKD